MRKGWNRVEKTEWKAASRMSRGRRLALLCAAGMMGSCILSGVPLAAAELLEVADNTLMETDMADQDTLNGAQEQLELEGSYTVDGSWVQVESADPGQETVYRYSGCEDLQETSELCCSYLDTDYTVYEYEQLRDMLTNHLVYSDVNAQVSTSALYTDAKDYLYILTADDPAKDYRESYCYVVGDRRCFLVTVKEYRSEAEQRQSEGVQTPQEAGIRLAQSFTWDAKR